MAYENSPIKKDEEDQTVLPSGQPTLSKTSGATLGTEQASLASPEAGKPTSSGRFTNISNYLEQNKEGASKLADRIVGDINQSVSAVDSSLNQAQDKFNQDVESKTVRFDQDLVNEAFNAPEQFVQDQNKVGRFNAIRNALYSGPSTFNPESIADIDAKKQRAAQLGSAADSEAGRKQLVQQQQKSKNTGLTDLNAALLQTDPVAKQKIIDTNESISSIDERVNQAYQQAQARAQQAEQETLGTRQAAEQAIQGGLSSFDQMLADKLNQVKTVQAPADFEAIRSKIASGQPVSPEEYAQFGTYAQNDDYNRMISIIDFWNELNQQATPESRKEPASKDLSKYITRDMSSIENLTKGQVASAEDYARARALEQLLGVQNTDLVDPNQAGQYSTDTFNFDVNQAWGDLIQKWNGLNGLNSLLGLYYYNNPQLEKGMVQQDAEGRWYFKKT